MTPDQFAATVRMMFRDGPGRDLLQELALRYAHPFHADPYKTAFNLGAQDLIHTLQDQANGR
jgi:hypothetical protein